MTERLASSYLSNPSEGSPGHDPSRLTTKEIKGEWGSFTNFTISYGLKPHSHEDCEEAAGISRALAEDRQAAKEEEARDTK